MRKLTFQTNCWSPVTTNMASMATILKIDFLFSPLNRLSNKMRFCIQVGFRFTQMETPRHPIWTPWKIDYLKCSRLFYFAAAIAENEHNMEPVQTCTCFILCSFLAVVCLKQKKALEKIFLGGAFVFSYMYMYCVFSSQPNFF